MILEDIKYTAPKCEIIEQNVELLQEILNQNNKILKLNKRILVVLENPMVQVSYSKEDTK